MKHLTLKSIASFVVLICGIGANGLAQAHEDEHHDATSAPKPETALPANAAEPAPATAEEVWQKIDARSAELQKTVQAGKLGEVHHLAYSVRDLVAVLPERSMSLPADKLAKVQGSVKYVATLAERLDQTGDANDKPGTRANYDKLVKVLAGLRQNYSDSGGH